MFQKPNVSGDSKSESDRLGPTPEAMALNYNERLTSASTSKQQNFHQNNYFSNGSKEETKSHHSKLRNSNFNSLSQHSQALRLSQEVQQSNNINQQLYQHNNHQPHQQQQQLHHHHHHYHLNQRSGQQHLTRSTTNPQLYQASHQQQQQQHAILQPSSQSVSSPSSTTLKSAFVNNNSESPFLSSSTNRIPLMKHRTSASINTIVGQSHNPMPRDEFKSVHNSRGSMNQQERDSEEVVTMIKEEELEQNPDEFKDLELETLGSFERNLPIELSFLIRQQAFCMARMNYLDRQIRELKESRPTNSQVAASSSTSVNTQSHTARTNAAITTKNGNFIPSDDSGGEYSRATISDDDELSSLLDQIAKSVRQDGRNVCPPSMSGIHQRANQYSVISNQQPQQYTIINPNQLHHQAVPVFVMGSPIAVAHPSSISSNVLPGVHFQPEPRYNQYYEDFYINNNSSSSTLHRHNGIRSQQFDSSISAIEQLISQKEKRQIKSQLKSADNWLKMRSSGGLCNLNDNSNFNSNINIGGNTLVGGSGGVGGGSSSDTNGSVNHNERNPPVSSSSTTIATENVMDENRDR